MPLIAPTWAVRAGAAVADFLRRFGVQAGPDLAEAVRGYASLADRDARSAFLHTLRAVIDLEGQRVSAADRLYLAERVPTLLIWGTADRIIPVKHGRSAVDQIPGSRLVEIPGAGLTLALTTPLQNQELVTPAAGIAYWEGLVDVSGASRGSPVTGRGYLEMTGYNGSLGRVMTR